MGRRHRNRQQLYADGSRQSIGDEYVEKACTQLDEACRKEAAMFTQQWPASSELIDMLYAPITLSRLRAAAGMVTPADWSPNQGLENTLNIDGHVDIDFEKLYCLPPDEHLFDPQPTAQGFINDLQTIRGLHEKWGAVKHMLRWFNKNATPGAIRALWPAALTLCPKSPQMSDMVEIPSRYHTPDGYSKVMPLARTTMGTVATMKLMGDHEERTNQGVLLTLEARTTLIDGVDVNLNHLVFCL